MSRAKAITDGETALAAIDIEVTPHRAFETLNSAEVERWWPAPGLYSMQGWLADLRAGGSWRVDVRLPDGTLLPTDGEYLVVEEPHLTCVSGSHWREPPGRPAPAVVGQEPDPPQMPAPPGPRFHGDER